MQASVPSLPQDDKARGLIGSKLSTFVKLNAYSSLACHAEQSEATDSSTVNFTDQIYTILRFTQDKLRHIERNREAQLSRLGGI